MNGTCRALMIGAALTLTPTLLLAEGNSLLVPALGRCTLNTVAEQRSEVLAACEAFAKDGDSKAQFELGEYYYNGQLTAQDLPKALAWFEQASLQGLAQAQWRLGLMFARGEGVPANRVQAFIVLKMAAINGAEDAMDSADQLAQQMSREELQAANQVLSQIFRNYLQDIQGLGSTPDFAPKP